MNIYDAIMKAAEHVERTPADYNFNRLYVPDKCGTTGCMLGWIGFFLGMFGQTNVAVKKAIGLPHPGAYTFLTEMSGGNAYMESNVEAAKTMRLYAEKHHAPPKVRTDVHPFVQKLLEHQPEILSPV